MEKKEIDIDIEPGEILTRQLESLVRGYDEFQTEEPNLNLLVGVVNRMTPITREKALSFARELARRIEEMPNDSILNKE